MPKANTAEAEPQPLTPSPVEPEPTTQEPAGPPTVRSGAAPTKTAWDKTHTPLQTNSELTAFPTIPTDPKGDPVDASQRPKTGRPGKPTTPTIVLDASAKSITGTWTKAPEDDADPDGGYDILEMQNGMVSVLAHTADPTVTQTYGDDDKGEVFRFAVRGVKTPSDKEFGGAGPTSEWVTVQIPEDPQPQPLPMLPQPNVKPLGPPQVQEFSVQWPMAPYADHPAASFEAVAWTNNVANVGQVTQGVVDAAKGTAKFTTTLPGVQYQVTVIAKGDGTTTQDSVAGPCQITTPPELRDRLKAPANLAVDGDPKKDEIDLKWDASDGADGYRIGWRTGEGPWSGDEVKGATAYKITGLTADTAYTIGVVATDSTQAKADSGSAALSAKTAAATPPAKTE